MYIKNRRKKLLEEGAVMPIVEDVTVDEQIVDTAEAEVAEAAKPEVVESQEQLGEDTEDDEAKDVQEPELPAVEPEVVVDAVQPEVEPAEPELPTVVEKIIPTEQIVESEPENPLDANDEADQPAVDFTIEQFDKKTINLVIAGYEQIEVSDADVGIYNTIENKKVRELIRALSEAAAGTQYTMAIKTLGHLSIFMSETKKEKDSGLLFQLLAQDFNNAKDIDEIDMSVFILTRFFRYVRSFSFSVILKGINSGYHPEFKVNALQMHEVFKELVTKSDRDMKIDKTVSFANKKDGRGKAFGVSNVFLNQNGSRLLTQYFTQK